MISSLPDASTLVLNPRVSIRLGDYRGTTIEVAFGSGSRRRIFSCSAANIVAWLMGHTDSGLPVTDSIELAKTTLGLSTSDAEQLVNDAQNEGLLLFADERQPPSAAEAAWLRWGWRDALDYHVATRDLVFEFGDEAGMAKQRNALLAWEEDARFERDEPSPGPYKEYPKAQRIPLQRSRKLIDTAVFGVTLYERRTCRTFNRRQLPLDAVSELFQHACGVVREFDAVGCGKQLLKTSPSGGARHPVEAYAVALNVEGLSRGLYHYNAREHSFECLKEAVDAEHIWKLVHKQGGMNRASLAVFFTVRWKRHIWKYRYPRSYRMVLFDVAHLVQTFILTATATNFHTFLTPAIDDAAAGEFLGIEDELEESVLYSVGLG